MKIDNQFNAVLAKSLFESSRNGFDFALFFKDWFKRLGTGYFFLFKRNLKATNIQLGELLALIRAYTTSGGAPSRELQFISTAAIREWLKSIILTLNPLNEEFKFQLIADLYGPLLQRIIIVDAFFTSCSVMTPPGVELDLSSICAFSGYVHSCGRNVFIRRIEKTLKEDFFQSIDEFLTRHIAPNKRVFFAVYAHEDFTGYDRDFETELRQGLDGVKLFIEKFWMGPASLVSVLKDMKERYRTQLEIPDPGNFRTKHKEFRNHRDVDTSRTLWLITDFSIDAASNGASTQRYFICYDQWLINENPFHIFDENKPAWVSHTTIPHTLLGAMINLTRPGWSDTRPIVLGDPFVGTGTTWLEGLKFSSISLKCSDLEPVAPLLAGDNLDFFSKSSTDLKTLGERLDRLIHFLQSETEPVGSPPLIEYSDEFTTPYNWAFRHVEEFITLDHQVRADLLEELSSKTLFDRIVFYLALRTMLRNVAAFERLAKDWRTAYIKETRELLRQIKELETLRSQQLQPVPPNEILPPEHIQIFQSKYSLGCSLTLHSLCEKNTKLKLEIPIAALDARDLARDSLDVIVTDPPYGFNTDQEALDLGALWNKALRSMILALKDGGQLVICLPAQSHTGRHLQFFTQKDFVTHHILLLADMLDREVITPATIVPSPGRLFKPPFYWESERALRRSIVHFQFKIRHWNKRNV
jgi:SAM-dependent methyltransferase